MPFYKYPKIVGIHRNKTIQNHLEYNPESETCLYMYQLKYDGANIQFIFEPGKTMQIAKRSCVIGNDNFNNVWDVIQKPEYQEILNTTQEICDGDDVCINLYGEIYGQGIQKRINYGPEKYIILFDMMINGYMLNIEDREINYPYLNPIFVRSYGPYRYDDIYQVEVPSGHEGVVFKPYDQQNGRRLRLKKKNEDFAEKGGKVKKVKEQDPLVKKYSEMFSQYLNRNRVLSYFSKEGEIQTDNQIGQYIKGITEDAKQDFLQDVGEEFHTLSKSQQKQVYKAGNIVYKLLQEWL